MSQAIDLLYFGHDFDANAPNNARLEDDFIQEVRQKYPSARLKNAYDPAKGYKQGVEIDGVSQAEYYAWIISRGWSNCSLSFSLLPSKEKDSIALEAQKLYPEAFERQ